MCKRHRIGVKKIRIEGSTSTLINAKSTKSDSMHVRDGLHKKVMEVTLILGHMPHFCAIYRYNGMIPIPVAKCAGKDYRDGAVVPFE